MTSDCSKETFELFSRLTELLQACMKSNKIEEAIKLAQERHGVLVNLLEHVSTFRLDRSEYAMQALECVRNEKDLASNNSSQSRSDFVSRKSAFKAYGTRAV